MKKVEKVIKRITAVMNILFFLSIAGAMFGVAIESPVLVNIASVVFLISFAWIVSGTIAKNRILL